MFQMRHRTTYHRKNLRILAPHVKRSSLLGRNVHSMRRCIMIQDRIAAQSVTELIEQNGKKSLHLLAYRFIQIAVLDIVILYVTTTFISFIVIKLDAPQMYVMGNIQLYIYIINITAVSKLPLSHFKGLWRLVWGYQI